MRDLRKDTQCLELYLDHCKTRLQEKHDVMTKEHYERMYLDAYHELHTLDKDRSKEFMDWWVRYAKW